MGKTGAGLQAVGVVGEAVIFLWFTIMLMCKAQAAEVVVYAQLVIPRGCRLRFCPPALHTTQ